MNGARRGVRALAHVLTTLVLAAGGVGAAAAPAAAESADPVLVLEVSNPAPYEGESAFLTAWIAAGPDSGNARYIQIYDVEGGYQVGYCGPRASSCSVNVHGTGQHAYIAYIAPFSWSIPTAPTSTSNPVAVSWQRPANAVTLAAVPPVTTVGRDITLSAASDDAVAWRTTIHIFDRDTGALLKRCQGATCNVTVSSATVRARRFIAAVYEGWVDKYYAWGSEAESPVVTGSWIADPAVLPTGTPASSLCDDGQQVIDSTTEGVHVKVYVKPQSPQRADVCVRLDDAAGGGFGGQFVVTPTVPVVGVTGVGVPTSDAQSGACTATTPNQVPGQHPITGGTIAGLPYLVDSYASNTAAWVCVQVGNNKTRVVLPISVPSATVTPGTQVTFNPDPGTPDLA
jgi:hypothetical protein